MMDSREARDLARRAVAYAQAADQAEAVVAAEESSLTRYANNRVNQNVTESNALVSVRAVVGKRIGVASTNRLDDRSLKACGDAAVAAARVATPDPRFNSLPAPEPVVPSERSVAATRDFSAEQRAAAVSAIVNESKRHGLSAAGKVRNAEHVVAVSNSLGVDVGGSYTGLECTALSMGASGSGWASFVSRDAGDFDPASVGAEAADLAVRSTGPTDLEAGEYPVVLAPQAVGDLLEFLSWVGFSAKAYEEGRSFLSNKLEHQIFNQPISITDNALADYAMGLTFDYEGMPKMPTPLIDYGVGVRPVTDSYWADRGGWVNSGHALPAPNPFGPMALNLEMAAGDATLEELIGQVERGVYVTRFHYVNVEDPVPVTLTGMTRDGTFLIENGRLTRPLKNLRFTQSVVDAFYDCEGVTEERRFVGTEESPVLVPGLLCAHFSFTGQTS